MGPFTDNICLPILRLQDELSVFPDFVDMGVLGGADKPSTKQAYADPAGVDYPMHNASAVWLGAAYAAAAPAYNIPVPDGVMVRLKEAADIYGIREDVDRVIALQETAVASSLKSASTGDVYALNDGGVSFYPVGSSYTLAESARGLETDFDRGRIPTKAARQAAETMVKRASTFTYGRQMLPDTIRLLGTPSLPDVSTISKIAAMRDRQAGTDLYSASVPETLSTHSRDELADIWRDLDSAFGLKASAAVPSIPGIFFSGITEEEVQKAAATTMFIRGAPCATAVLTSIPDEAISAWYPDPEKQASVRDVISAAREDGVRASILLEKMPSDLADSFIQNASEFHSSRV